MNLCARALAIKADYEKSSEKNGNISRNDEKTSSQRDSAKSWSRGDLKAMAKKLNGHISRCPMCSK